jgi:hypothetical protein
MGVKPNTMLALVLFIALLAITYTPVSTVAMSTDETASQGGYIVKAANSGSIASPSIVYDSITQGETNWHSTPIYGYITKLNVDLYWGNPSNSLQLTVYSPDGHTFGPYYDGADGVIDGRINIEIDNPDGIAQGTWYYKVYGYSVTGTQSYSI